MAKHSNPQHAGAAHGSSAHAAPVPHGGHAPHEHEGEHHIVPIKTYAFVILALVVLLIITVAAYEFDLSHIWGPANILMALAIAITKMMFILLIFMHVKYSSKLVQVFAVAAYFFVVIMFCGIYADFYSRHWLTSWVPMAAR